MTLFGWRIVRIWGRSMEPMLHPDSFALFRPTRRVRQGDIVLVDHAEFGLIVKQVDRIAGGHFRLTGLSPLSTTTDRMGPVPADRVLGRHVLTLPGPSIA